MKVEIIADGRYLVSDGTERIELSQTNYEDIFYAIPIDNGSLYLLLNDTILENPDARTALKRLVDKMGGIEPAMSELQARVKEVAPTADATAPAPIEENPFQEAAVDEGDFVRVVIKGAPAEASAAELAEAEVQAEPAEISAGGKADLVLPSDEEIVDLGAAGETADLVIEEPPSAKPAKASEPPKAPVKKPAPPVKGKPVKEEAEELPTLEAVEPAAVQGKAGKPAAPAAKAGAPGKPGVPAKAPPAAKGKPKAEEEEIADLGDFEMDLEAEAPVVAKEKPGKPVAPAAKSGSPGKPGTPSKPLPAAKGPPSPKEKSAPKPAPAPISSDSEFDNLPDLADDEVVSLDSKPAKAAAPPAKTGSPPKPAAPAKPEPAAAKTPASVAKPAPGKVKPGYPEKKEVAGAGKPTAPVPGGPAKVRAAMGPDGKPLVTLTKLGPNEFVIGYGDLCATLSKERYEKLYETCPIDTSSLFRIMMAEILDGPAKTIFRKIIAAAGHSKPILDALNDQVQKLDPD